MLNEKETYKLKLEAEVLEDVNGLLKLIGECAEDKNVESSLFIATEVLEHSIERINKLLYPTNEVPELKKLIVLDEKSLYEIVNDTGTSIEVDNVVIRFEPTDEKERQLIVCDE